MGGKHYSVYYSQISPGVKKDVHDHIETRISTGGSNVASSAL